MVGRVSTNELIRPTDIVSVLSLYQLCPGTLSYLSDWGTTKIFYLLKGNVVSMTTDFSNIERVPHLSVFVPECSHC